jgi:hypothetical protein
VDAAWSDHDQQPVVLAVEDRVGLRTAPEHDLGELVAERQLIEQHGRRYERLDPLDSLVANLLCGLAAHHVDHLLVLSDAWKL